jgi:iron complex outermembrane recepter protein
VSLESALRIAFIRHRRITGVAILLAGATVVHAQSTADPSALADESLDQLLNTPVVTVSKKQQRLSKVPAAVYVITKEAIHRTGAVSIPEILRLAPGVQVARINATQWAVSIRGFNGLWSNKLLVMIDGRTIYSEIFSGVDWEMQDLMKEDIERIEVVRGPGSSIWGANAVNGVVNIVTKQAADSSGTMLAVSTGNLDRFRAAAQYGCSFGQTSFRIYSKVRDQSLPGTGGVALPDTHKQAIAGFRIDSHLNARDKLTVQGDGYVGETHDSEIVPVTLPSFLPGISDVNGHPASFDLQAKWTRSLSDRSEVSLQAFGAKEQRVEEGVDARNSTFDVELQHSFAVGERNAILWGLESRTIQDRIFGPPTFYFTPVGRTNVLTAGFISDDISLVPDRLQLSVGTKIEKYNFTRWQPEPSIRMAWTPNENQTVWASLGRAVRIPSRFERDIRVDAGALPGPLPILLQVNGNPQATSETLVAYEVGHRMKLGRKISLDTATYYNHYGTLRSTQELAPQFELEPVPHLLVPLEYNQLAQGNSLGFESVANFDASSRWRMTASYGFGDLDIQSKPGNNSTLNIYRNVPGSLPKHQAQIRSSWDIGRNLQLDIAGYYVDRLPAQSLPSYTTADLRLGWHVTSSLALSANVTNIFNKVHGEWITTDDVLYRGRAFGRTASVTAVWKF